MSQLKAKLLEKALPVAAPCVSVMVGEQLDSEMLRLESIPCLTLLKQTKSWNCFNNNTIFFFYLPPTSNHLHPLQVENCNG